MDHYNIFLAHIKQSTDVLIITTLLKCSSLFMTPPLISVVVQKWVIPNALNVHESTYENQGQL